MSALACRDNNLLSLLVQDLMFMAKKNWKKNDIQVEEYLRKLHCNIIDEKCGQYKFLQRTLNIIYHFASQKKVQTWDLHWKQIQKKQQKSYNTTF